MLGYETALQEVSFQDLMEKQAEACQEVLAKLGA